ncbi:ribonuclease III [Opitutales bacterium ASA1]|uniref:ribonuclease III n=1 Tax=Congregicoccus parvus TaxID=3081749 RepID=UPI002B3089D6|nr:ribonuclease III [Opitutales bacterium ASA1]
MNDGETQALFRFQARIGHVFRDRGLLELCLTHPSVLQQKPSAPHNQRLEFLGDAVLQLIVTERLHALFPDEREGPLTSRRATITRGVFLADLAREIGIDRVLRVSAAERALDGHLRNAALEDAVEALVAAVFLDSDFEHTRNVVLAWYGDLHERLARYATRINPKGRLQELVQPLHGNNALAYRVTRDHGPPHAKEFDVEVTLLGQVLGRGSGTSKKEAEERAADDALSGWAEERTGG